MPSQGPLSPSSVVDDASYGSVDWRNPGNATSSDNVYAYTIALTGPVSTHYLKATGFGFSIPGGMQITGIKVEIERHALMYVIDDRVRLVKGGVVQSHDKASSSSWPSSDAYASYGGDGDTWGDWWGPQDINSADFGVVLAARVGDGTDPAIPYVDHIRMTVYYTVYYTESSQHVAAQVM